MAMVTVNEVEYYYYTLGAGYPVVLIAGYCCDHTYWFPIADELAKKYQVIIFDNRAVGQTKDNSQPLSVERMAADMSIFIQNLELKKPHVIGQSMGGAIAQVFSSRYQEQVNKLILLTTTAKIRKSVLFAFDMQLKMRKANFDFDWFFSSMLPWVYSEEFLTKQANIDVLKHEILSNKFPQSVNNQQRQLDVLKEFDNHHDLKNIRASTLIVSGKQDVISLPFESKVLNEHITHSQHVELNCAHGIVSEIPSKLLELIRSHLA